MGNPDRSKKFGARIVAYLDTAFSIFISLLTVVLIAHQINLYLLVGDDHQSFYQLNDAQILELEEVWNGDVKTAQSMFFHVGWVFVVIGLIYSIISMRGAIALFKATQLDAKPYPALRNALIWRNIAVVFMVIRVMAIIIAGVIYGIAMTLSIVTAIINGIFLFAVFDFILELEQDAKLPTTQRMSVPENIVQVKV